MEYLILNIPESNEGEPACEWLVVENGRKKFAGTEIIPLSLCLSQIPTTEAGRRVIVLTPASRVLLTSVSIPLGQHNQLNNLVPFLVEESLAQDITGLHFARGSLDKENNRLPVAVVEKVILREWLRILDTCRLKPFILTPAMLALPYAPGTWSLFYDESLCMLRTGAREAYAVEAAMIGTLFQSALNTAPALPERIDCYCTLKEKSEKEDWLDRLQKNHASLAFRVQVCESLADLFAKTYLSGSEALSWPINLLQGEFRRPAGHRAAPRKWLMLGGACALWLLLQILLCAGQAFYFSYKARQYTQNTQGLYKQLFPEDSKIIDPVLQMKTHLASRSLSRSGGFLSLLSKLSSQWPGTEGTSLKIETMAYAENSHTLTVSIMGNDNEFIHQLAKQLNASGLDARILSVTSTSAIANVQLAVTERDR